VRFTLIRHGETEDPRPGLEAIGHDDPALTTLGKRQAGAMAAVLRSIAERGATVEQVYTSPLRAATDTADAIASGLSLDRPLVAPELITLTPEVLPKDGAIDALESIQSRAWDLIESLNQRHDQASTLVRVTHELTVRALVCRALSMPLTDLLRFRLDPASMTTIDYRTQPRERTLIAYLNETCHLE
jgi:broad specificity phosphatase PhoE